MKMGRGEDGKRGDVGAATRLGLLHATLDGSVVGGYPLAPLGVPASYIPSPRVFDGMEDAVRQGLGGVGVEL